MSESFYRIDGVKIMGIARRRIRKRKGSELELYGNKEEQKKAVFRLKPSRKKGAHDETTRYIMRSFVEEAIVDTALAN